MKTSLHDPPPSEKPARSDAGVDCRILLVWTIMAALMAFAEPILQQAVSPSPVNHPSSSPAAHSIPATQSTVHGPQSTVSLPPDLVPVPNTAADPATGLPLFARSRQTGVLFRFIPAGSFKMGSP